MFQLQGYPMFQTTVGKLNFFRWALEKGVLRYIETNLDKIETAMNTNTKEMQRVRRVASSSTSNATTDTATRTTTRKRIVSTVVPTSAVMQKHEYTVEIRFD